MIIVKRQKVETFFITGVCNSCGGEMKPTGMERCSNPPQIGYQCSSCGFSEYSTEVFPRVEYVEVDDA